MAWFRRWRHLTLFLISVAVTGALAEGLLLIASRPRPFDVTIIGSWEGFRPPRSRWAVSRSIIAGIVYMLVPPGRPRMIGKWSARSW